MAPTTTDPIVLPTGHSRWRADAVVGDRYRLERLIGIGAMAEVWQAEHLTLQKPVAVKLITAAQPDDVLKRFLREAQAAAQLRSPHIVQIFDLGIMEGQGAYMAMELLEGESLRARLHREGKLTPKDTLSIISDLARGLAVAHDAGIVHRDIKPENVFLAAEDRGVVVKIVDFGIAKRTHFEGVDQLATQHGVLVGTAPYASPEQITGTGVDRRSDLWQLAVLTFECLCGVLPFDAPTKGQLLIDICCKPPPVPSQVATVPPGFDGWFARATRREPAERFPSSRQLAAALSEVLEPEHTVPLALQPRKLPEEERTVLLAPVPTAPAAPEPTQPLAPEPTQPLAPEPTQPPADSSADKVALPASLQSKPTGPPTLLLSTAAVEPEPAPRGKGGSLAIAAALAVLVLAGGGLWLHAASSPDPALGSAGQAAPASSSSPAGSAEPAVIAGAKQIGGQPAAAKPEAGDAGAEQAGGRSDAAAKPEAGGAATRAPRWRGPAPVPKPKETPTRPEEILGI